MEATNPFPGRKKIAHILEECYSLGLLRLQMPCLSTNTQYVVSLGGQVLIKASAAL